ncbi:MAG: hypothetical protein V1855_04025 [bacterium]
MGKTLRLDAKYSNELSKCIKLASATHEKTKELDKQTKKRLRQTNKGKRVLKKHFQQRAWPLGNEQHKGRKV